MAMVVGVKRAVMVATLFTIVIETTQVSGVVRGHDDEVLEFVGIDAYRDAMDGRTFGESSTDFYSAVLDGDVAPACSPLPIGFQREKR